MLSPMEYRPLPRLMLAAMSIRFMRRFFPRTFHEL
jgi:hypothetical protein